MKTNVPSSTRSIEHADRREGGSTKRWTTVSGKRELLPSDPYEVVKILRERRNNSPAAKAKAKMAADAKKRGF
jgi:hypothetical protein